MEFWARRPLPTNLIGFLLLLGAWIGLAELSTSLAGVAGLPPGFDQQLYYLTLLAATVLVVRYYDRLPLAWSGIGIDRRSGGELLLGVGLGVAMALCASAPVAILAIVERGSGTLRFASPAPAGEWIYSSMLIAVNAAGEELLFRGYLFQRVVEVLGTGVAAVAASALFMLAHAWNPNVTTVGLANVFLGGVFFALCYLRSGSLWLPIGAHLAWNFFLGRIAGLPVSGQDFGGSLFRLEIAGPPIVTGGSFGPEGGLVATLALAMGAVVLLRSSLFEYSPYLYARTFWSIERRQRSEAR